MNRKNCFRVLIFAVCMLFVFGCGGISQPSAEYDAAKDSPLPQRDASSPNADTVIKVFVNDLPLTGYGYDIISAKIHIHQPNIPAVAGNRGFSSEENAYKTALLVLYKIQNNIAPPRVDMRELDSLRVLN